MLHQLLMIFPSQLALEMEHIISKVPHFFQFCSQRFAHPAEDIYEVSPILPMAYELDVVAKLHRTKGRREPAFFVFAVQATLGARRQ